MNAVIDHAGQLVSGHAESHVGEDAVRYSISPLGLIVCETDEITARRIADRIELYLRRSQQGLAIVNNQLAFVDMEPIGEVQP